MQILVTALAWLAQLLGLGTVAAALSDPAILEDHGQLVVALLGAALALAGALPSVIGSVRAWWAKVRAAAAEPRPREGGHARAPLLAVIAISGAIAVACATPMMMRASPARAIEAGQSAVAEYFRRTVMLEAAGAITPDAAIARNERALQALDVLRDARAVLTICRQAGTAEHECVVAGDVLARLPDLADRAEIEILRRTQP